MPLASAFSGVAVLFAVMALGFILGRIGLIPEPLEEPLSRLTLYAAIPCTLFMSCIRYMSLTMLTDMGWLLALPLISILIGWLLALAAARLLRIDAKRRGLFCVVFALSNSIFIGLPLCQSFFGEAALPYVTMFFPANTLVFWTIGVAALSSDGGQPYRWGVKTLGRILSPPLIAAFLGTAFAISGLTLPAFADTALGYVGGLTVPLNLLIVGAMLSRMGRNAFVLGRTGWLALVGRFLLLPAMTLGLCLLARKAGLSNLPDTKLMISVFTLESAMPVMNQAVIMARVVHADHALSARLLTASCVLGLVLLPIWVWGVGYV